MSTIGVVITLALACSSAARAQDARPDAIVAGAPEGSGTPAPEPGEPGAPRSFAVDVAHDYRNFVSWKNGLWLGVGGLAALAVHPADEPVQQDVLESGTSALPGGAVYGSQLFQVPVAAAWWILGHASGNPRHAAAGRDLLRAQISVFSWTYAIKYAANRTRPNGDPRSFPSGHASTSFATAMVLQEHYGWKLGVPAFAAAAYTAASRVTANQHWVSDVVFGAALGMVSGRTVTLHMHDARVTLAPVILPGGGGVVVTALK